MNTPTIEEYKTLLKNHDWYYEYADDHDVWRKGVTQRDTLYKIQKQIDANGEIWNSIAPKECKLNIGIAPPARLPRGPGF